MSQEPHAHTDSHTAEDTDPGLIFHHFKHATSSCVRVCVCFVLPSVVGRLVHGGQLPGAEMRPAHRHPAEVGAAAALIGPWEAGL